MSPTRQLSKISARLTLRSTIVAIVMLMALLWVLFIFGGRLGLGDFVVEYALIGYGLFFVLLILLIGCLLFFVRDIYIHSVTNKHPRATVAARVLGVLGAAVAFTLFCSFTPPILLGLYSSFMAIGGVKLAHSSPKVAGGLMLLAGITAWIVALFVPYRHPLGFLLGFPIVPHLGDELFGLVISGWASQLLVPTTLLISGGVLALLAGCKKWHQEKLSLSGRADDGPNKCW